MIRQRSILLYAVFVALAPCVACAQSSSYFLPGNTDWELGVWGAEAVGKAAGEGFGQTHISMAGFHAARVIYESPMGSSHHRTLEYTLELQPLFVVTSKKSAYGGGFSPVGLRWNFAPRREGRYRPYLEANGGAMFTQKDVPPGRTDNFNFTLAAGPGIMIALARNQALSVGLRYWHLSNAYLGHDNPSFNTMQFVVGYYWLLRGHHARQKQAVNQQQVQKSPTRRVGETSANAH